MVFDFYFQFPMYEKSFNGVTQDSTSDTNQIQQKCCNMVLFSLYEKSYNGILDNTKLCFSY